MLAEHLTQVPGREPAEVGSLVLLAVTVFVQFAHDVPAQLPAAARDRDGHHRAPPGGPPVRTSADVGHTIMLNLGVEQRERRFWPVGVVLLRAGALMGVPISCWWL
jgi:hypothetical protein